MKKETFGDEYEKAGSVYGKVDYSLCSPSSSDKRNLSAAGISLLVQVGPGKKREIGEMQVQAALPPFTADV